MKKQLPLFVFLFMLMACAPATPTPKSARANVQEIMPSPSFDNSPAMTIEAASTDMAQANANALDSQQQAIYSRQTADAAIRYNVDATVTHESLLYSYAQMTQIADAQTQTSIPTSVPQTQTAESISFTQAARSVFMQGTAMAMTRTAPTQVVAMAMAQSQATFAPVMQVIQIFLMLCGCAMLLAITWFALRNSPAPRAPGQENLIVPSDMIFERNDNVYKRVDPEIPCTLDELLLFADGIVNQHKTMANGQWEATPIHRRLKAGTLRTWMTSNHFALAVTGPGGEPTGEATITKEGRAFLRVCFESTIPPSPYRCMAEDAPPTLPNQEFPSQEMVNLAEGEEEA